MATNVQIIGPSVRIPIDFGAAGDNLWKEVLDAVRYAPHEVDFYLTGGKRTYQCAALLSVVPGRSDATLILHVNLTKESGEYRVDTLTLDTRTGLGELVISS